MSEHRSSDTIPIVGPSNALDCMTELLSLPRRGWAWEMLRRNPTYRIDCGIPSSSKSNAIAAGRWGLLQFEDPDKSALDANTFWSEAVARDVLPIVAHPRNIWPATTLTIGALSCRATRRVRSDGQTQDILFADGGRALQVTVVGSAPIEEALLLTPALPAPSGGAERLIAVKRFTDLVKYGRLRPALYPAERSARRLCEVLIALDGWLEGVPHRDIAVRLFGAESVDSHWADAGNHFRDRVRRAIRYGRNLMDGGYRRLLGTSHQ